MFCIGSGQVLYVLGDLESEKPGILAGILGLRDALSYPYKRDKHEKRKESECRRAIRKREFGGNDRRANEPDNRHDKIGAENDNGEVNITKASHTTRLFSMDK